MLARRLATKPSSNYSVSMIEPSRQNRRRVLGEVVAAIFVVSSIVTYRHYDDEFDNNSRSLREHLLTSTFDEEPPTAWLQESFIESQFGPDPHAGRDHLQMVLDGKLGLASVRYSPNSFAISGPHARNDSYENDVYVEFCDYDISLHRRSPADYPTISDITSVSDHCGEHRYAMPLRAVVDAVRAHDNDQSNGSSVRALPVSGILFHEGRSGAGLITNALHTLKSTRVVSEHPAILDALRACDMIHNRHRSDNCSAEKQKKLVQDIVMLLSRNEVGKDEDQPLLFMKMHSTASAYLKDLRASFPEAKWAFVYREADAVLAKVMENKRDPCVKSRRNPPFAVASMAQSLDVDLEQLTRHEICAIHLSTFLQTAKDEHESTGTGILVSYDEDILGTSYNAIMDEILPYLGVEDAKMDSDVRDEVSSVLTLKSNARGDEGDERNWDATKENIDITAEVRDASNKFMLNAMDAILHSSRRGL